MRRGGKGRPIQERYECTGVVIKQLQRSFLPVSLSASGPCSPLLPSSSVRLSLCLLPFVSSLSSSFWTLSRCACGNFAGSFLPGLLARSLTSLSSVYFHRHFSWHLRRLFSIGPFIFPSGFALSVFTSSPVAEHLRARERFPFHFRFYRVTSLGYSVPDKVDVFFRTVRENN